MTDYEDLIMGASANIDDIHSPVSDTEEAIIVNVSTRDFTILPTFNRIIGVVGDRNSEEVSFRIDRFIDSHDISECAEHKVFWRNIETQKDGEAVLTVKLSETDENAVLLGWLISEEVTEDPGDIEFSLSIADFDEDGQEIYRWGTIDGSGLRIVDSSFREENPGTIQKSYVSLVDQGTGKKYKVYVSNGKLMMVESEG